MKMWALFMEVYVFICFYAHSTESTQLCNKSCCLQSFGGLTEVIQRKRWGKIAEYLRIPKGTQDPGKKLDDIYCKYILPYDTLSQVEREELLRLVEEEHEEANKRKLERSREVG